MNGKEIVSRFLEALAKQDVQGISDVLAENIVFEMPFALPGLPDRVEGRSTVVEFLEQFLGKEHGIFTGWELRNFRIYPGDDPDQFITEYDGQGVVAQNGHQYRQKYITLLRVSDGRISLWREYLNPLPLQAAIASINESKATSSAPAPEQSSDQDAWLDTALQETFPASDPISTFHADDAIFLREFRQTTPMA